VSVRAVAIVGAGIAGLTAALCFARRGIASDIFEQAETLSEVGAGLQISPNAARVLDTLGLLSALEATWCEPQSVRLLSGETLHPLTHVPLGAAARSRWNAPYGVLHRATLQKALLDAVRAEPLCALSFGRKIERDDPALLSQHTGARPDLVIGADGVWSRLRAFVPGAAEARFSGTIAWRFLVPFDRAPPVLDRRHVSAFLGPSAHLVAYPLNEADAFNLVAIHQAQRPGTGWSQVPTDESLRLRLAAFSGWNAALLRLFGTAEAPLIWPLFECGDGRWFDGRQTILIGDAAHATTPFAAQGAAMAIEDAAELAAAATAGGDLVANLAAFETHRRARIRRVRARAAFNRFAYHAPGPIAFARNIVLGLRSPESLAADFDWLYGYRAAD
jgi:salicylate hydroxylase